MVYLPYLDIINFISFVKSCCQLFPIFHPVAARLSHFFVQPWLF